MVWHVSWHSTVRLCQVSHVVLYAPVIALVVVGAPGKQLAMLEARRHGFVFCSTRAQLQLCLDCC